MKTKDFHEQASALAALPYTILLKRDSDGDIVASVKELDGCVAHGQDEMEALAAIESMKMLWIESSLRDGDPVPRPDPEEDDLPSGKWVQRVPRSLHKRLSDTAKAEGVSLNTLVTSYLSAAVSVKTIESYKGAVTGLLSSMRGYSPHPVMGPSDLCVISNIKRAKLKKSFGDLESPTKDTEAFIQYLSAQMGSLSSKNQEIRKRAPKEEAEANRQFAYQA
jgi:predicted RNase H-like HicB family nuclease